MTLDQVNVDLRAIMETAIQTDGLTKIYTRNRFWRPRMDGESLTAVSNVSFSVDRGEMYGLLGPNGAGKTTLVKMLCTLILPTSGKASVAGIDLKNDRAIRSVTGLVVSDERSFYWRLSLRRNLQFFAALHGLYGRTAEEHIGRVLHAVNLEDRSDQRFSDLSSGMRQRLAIARALLHIPRVLVLDEPTRSLDPVATAQIHSLLNQLRENGDITILLITHDLAEAESMCERVALMHEGQIQAVGAPKDLRRRLDPRRHYVLTVDRLSLAMQEKLRRLLPHYHIADAGMDKDRNDLNFTTGESDGQLEAVLNFLNVNGVRVYTIEGTPPTMEAVFAHFTGESGRGAE